MYYTQCCDERALMRDSYYVGLIILAVHEGDCQLRPQLFIKAMKYGPGLRRVYMCVCVCPRAESTNHLLGSFCSNSSLQSFPGLTGFFFFFAFSCLFSCPSKTQLVSVLFFTFCIIFNTRVCTYMCIYMNIYTHIYCMYNIHKQRSIELLAQPCTSARSTGTSTLTSC